MQFIRTEGAALYIARASLRNCLVLLLAILCFSISAQANHLAHMKRFTDRAEVPADLRELLISEMTNSTIESNLIRNAFPERLLPADFRSYRMHGVPDGKGLVIQEFVEAVILQFLETKIGGEICAFLETDKELAYFFGIRDETVPLAKAKCSKKFASEVIPKNINHRSSRIFDVRREWIFAIHGGSILSRPLDSWTNAANATVLFFTWEELTYVNILKRIIHEIAVFFDMKFLTDIQWARYNGRFQGYKPISVTELENGDRLHRFDPAKAPRALSDEEAAVRFFKQGDDRVLNLCVGLTAISQNYIAYGAQVGRALEVEIQAINDLIEIGYPLQLPSELAEYSILSADERLELLTETMIPIIDNISVFVLFAHSPQEMNLCPSFNAFDFRTYLEVISGMEAEVQPNVVPRMPLADFVLLPDLGRNNIRTNNGPRPNFAGGIRKGGRGGRGGG